MPTCHADTRGLTLPSILVPCTSHKIWDREPAAGPVPARRAYTDRYFRDWCRHAEATGDPWFILSTHYGLVPPDQPVEPYDVPVGRALLDEEYLERLGGQFDGLGLSPDDVVVLDWERFQELVARAMRVAPAQIRLRKIRF